MTWALAFTICFVSTVLTIGTVLYLIYRSEIKREEKIRGETSKQLSQIAALGLGDLVYLPASGGAAPAKTKKASKKETFPLPEIKTEKPKKDIN